MKLILIRHGEAYKNLTGTLHGHNDTDGLTELGMKQIEKTIPVLKKYANARLYSSREKRAAQSAGIIGLDLDCNFETISGLEERNWGEYSGKTWEEVQNILAPMELEERFNFTPPKGESWKDFLNRLIKNISDLIQKHPGKDLTIVTHGGSIRALLPYLLDIPKEESFGFNPKNASISIFEIKDKGFEPVLIDDTSHLSV